METHEMYCKDKKRIGGIYRSDCHIFDGQKYVCMDDITTDISSNKCIVYSFGIGGDWSFEDTMGRIGCHVYAFDPTIKHTRVRSTNVIFESLGICAIQNKEGTCLTLDKILERNGHTHENISYLKLDIEKEELKGFPVWLKSGSLDKVQQIAVEVHLQPPDDLKVAQNFLQTFKELNFQGNYRLINYEANNCWKNHNSKYQYFSLFEIVLKKIQTNPMCNT